MKLLYLALLLVSVQLVCAGRDEESSESEECTSASKSESSEESCEDKGCEGDPNARKDSCGDPCPVTCANKGKPQRCPRICLAEGCRCKDGYVRDFKNRCIKPTDCPKCKGSNEFYACGSACDRECATLGDPCKIINKKCVERCYCNEGYARDKNGVCIKVEKCPPRKCPTDPNAIIVPCGDPCPVTCRNKDDKGPRPCIEICMVNGCKCKDGYVKDEKDGKCIKAEDCPKLPKCGQNEEIVYQSCPDLTCKWYFENIIPPCRPNPSPACKCKNGFVRGENNKCIKPKECCKDPNSELVSCPNPCPGGSCNTPDFKPCKVKCFPFGCQCKKGFVKKSDKDATCIAKKSCKQCSSEEDGSSSSEEETPKCGKNEKPVKENCPDDDTCKTLLQGGKPQCKPNPKFKCGCRCKDGYVRDDDKKCMEAKKCCKDPNATLVQCPSSCPGGTCQSPKFAPCLAMCRAWGCQCKEGYVKKSNTDPTCVALKSCKKESSEECDDDPKKKCGPGEEYNDCPHSCPPEVTCESYFVGIFPLCPIMIDKKNCNPPACRCKPDYVRNKNGKCVLPKECCTDPNATLVQCPNSCPGGTCQSPKFAPCLSVAMCRAWGCQCKEGYVKKSSTDPTCVALKSCKKESSKESDSSEECDDDPKKKCGPGEEYNDCPHSCPPEVTCESYFVGIFPMCAIMIDKKNCNPPACRCKPDYVRNKNGKCVLPKECCTDPNSELAQSVSQCPGGTCEQPEIASCDARTLRYGCVCKKGYLKASATDKTCVPIKSCDKKCEDD